MSQHYYKDILQFMVRLKGMMLLLIMCLMLTNVDAQTIHTNFGKNRVQYHDDFNNWWMYETDHFVSFWYGKGRNIARSVMQLAEMDHHEIEGLLAHSMNDKIRIIIYLDHSDYSQTNIAYWDTQEAGGAGIAQFYDNKVIVYFDGNHQNLRKQIRAGITRAFLISMFKGITIQEIYHNLVSSDLPNWFVTGLVAYISKKWPAETEEELKSYFLQDQHKVKKFSSFSNDHAELAGHSMWNFLAHKYGNQSVSDFLYLVRMHKDLNRAFKYVYGYNSRYMYREWYQFYEQHYGVYDTIEPDGKEQNKSVLDLEYPITRVLLDEKAERLFFVENNYGRVKLQMRDLKTGKETTLLKYGYKNEHQLTDFHYPLIKYDAGNHALGVIYEHRDQLFYRSIQLTDNSYMEQLFPESVQRIYSFDLNDPGFLIIAGSTDGFSDLHYYDIEKRQFERISDDYFDEKAIIKGVYRNKEGVFLLSNNTADSIIPVRYDSFPPVANFDVYFFDTERQTGKRILESVSIDESDLILHKDQLLWLSDRDYFKGPEIMEINSGKRMHFDLKELHSNIISHDYRNDKYVLARKTVHDQWSIELYEGLKVYQDDTSEFASQFEIPFESGSADLIKSAEEKIVVEDIEIDESLLFQTKFPDEEEDLDPAFFNYESEQVRDNGISIEGLKKKLPIFNRSRAVAARLRFSFNELVTKVDNEALFEGLETYNEYNNEYVPPQSGVLVKTSVKDLFEDHVIEGGFRLASDFRGMEYFLSYDDQKNKVDWKYALYRRTRSSFENLLGQGADPDKLKLKTNLALVRAKYPFDIYRSLHFTGILRFDNTIVTASNLETLDVLGYSNQRIMLGTEYIFDNTSDRSTNILSGTRYKFFARFSNRFNVQFSDPVKFQLSVGRMAVLGFDARHYLDVLKYGTLAFRLAGQTSFGNEKNLYFLGGMENWFFARHDNTYPIPQEQQFAFKVLAANVRGFPYNIRNGSSFALMNIEFRLPVFRYLFRSHIKFSFFRDFQLTGFFDAGSAWYGLTPYSPQNEANVYYHEAPPAILLKIKQFNDPLVAGMGFGMRTSLFGYFLKLDYAWGIQTGKILKPMLYFSMGHDF